ncbi:unknown similar to AcMNPV orf7 [Choristoneura biennis entomopoxvirus]|uniref:Uncharacterized protein n=1 Tax=Choristoneura biennis entomopoxvirus TaxID=10288 RepID=A0A916NXJ7_CBEPV|nr:unknown similar to AcMNPV orf7 [Choristoneura biennis entomopoxvirus]CCU55618.1 unknown similar to AcMNPV orf7 [Choristoneura biennis entomopoxvirus]
MNINNNYNIDNYGNDEMVYLCGKYSTKYINNKNYPIIISNNPLLHDKKPLYVCNTLYRTDTDNIDKLIDVLIRYTYDECKDLNLDYSKKSTIKMLDGLNFPTKEVCFEYKNKIFILYGRYIYGYNKEYVTFIDSRLNINNYNVTNSDSDYNSSDSDSYYESDTDDSDYYNKYKKNDIITNNKIILHEPYIHKSHDNKYNYAFKIVDSITNILDAFGIYR